MVKGLDVFKSYFKEFKNQYVLIGGGACDILFDENEIEFRATRDLDMVLIIEAITIEFVKKLWEFIKDGEYQIKTTNGGKPQFYRFSKPKNDSFPKMIELFCRKDFELAELNGLTPIHVDDSVSSLSAILLNDDYYKILIDGLIVINGLSILRPEYLILFKAKAYLDLSQRKQNGEHVDSIDIKKHKKDVLRIVSEIALNEVTDLPISVKNDIDNFIENLKIEPYDINSLKEYKLKNEGVIERLMEIFD